MAGVGTLQHETVGAAYLFAAGFSSRVADLVAGHVNAKRYLVATNPNYLSKLSDASLETLRHQGGAMSEDEVRQFEANPDHRWLLKLRAWDEAAKSPDLAVPAFEHYEPVIRRHLDENRLRPEDTSYFSEQGYLHIKGLFSDRQVAELISVVSDLQQWPDRPGQWMKYYEPGGLLCRIENFVQHHRHLGELIQGQRLNQLVGDLMGEAAVLFKEKINFKLPGGGGFEAHQDAPAFTSFGHHYHITMMIAFDEATRENGCLELVPGRWSRSFLPMTSGLTITQEQESLMNWQAIDMAPGDILLFDSYLPHRSRANFSSSPRRALYATYNRASDGDVREAYFSEKRRVFPPDADRVPGQDYPDAGVFNVGNPVDANPV